MCSPHGCECEILYQDPCHSKESRHHAAPAFQRNVVLLYFMWWNPSEITLQAWFKNKRRSPIQAHLYVLEISSLHLELATVNHLNLYDWIYTCCTCTCLLHPQVLQWNRHSHVSRHTWPHETEQINTNQSLNKFGSVSKSATHWNWMLATLLAK